VSVLHGSAIFSLIIFGGFILMYAFWPNKYAAIGWTMIAIGGFSYDYLHKRANKRR